MEWIISIAAALVVVAVYVAGVVLALKDDCPDLEGALLLTWPFILGGVAWCSFLFKIAVFGA